MASFELLQEIELGTGEADRLRRSASRAVDYLLCENLVRIHSNADGPIESFDAEYSPFRTSQPAATPHIALYCLVDAAPARGCTFLLAGKAYRVTDEHVLATPFTSMAFLLFRAIRSHYLVHAGCVSRDGRATIISGTSGMGKTTLVCYLVARGMGFLSDEVAPIGRRDGLVQPFPLELGIRPGPADALIRDAPTRDVEHMTDAKRMLNAMHLNAAPVTQPIPLQAVYFLTPQPTPHVLVPRVDEATVRVVLLGITDDFVADLTSSLDCELLESDKVESRFPSLRLRTPDLSAFIKGLRPLAARHEVPIAGIQDEGLAAPDHSAEPELVPISTSVGVLELAKRIHPPTGKPHHRRRFPGSHGRSHR